MPAGVTDFGATSWLESLFGVSPVISGYYIALLSDEPGADMDGDALADLEPDDPAGYQRKLYGTGGANWASNSNFLATLNDVTFGLPTVAWGDVSHFGLCSAVSSGDLYAWGELANPQYLDVGSRVVIPAGGIVVSLAALDYSIAV